MTTNAKVLPFRRAAPRHPEQDRIHAGGRVLARVLTALQAMLLAYYAALGLVAFIPLLVNAHYAGAVAMALVGGTFGSLLLARMRQKKLAHDSKRSSGAAAPATARFGSANPGSG